MNKKEIIEHLTTVPAAVLYDKADTVQKRYFSDQVFLRGIIDFSNFCARNCLYCGLRKDNRRLNRFRMSSDQILQCASVIVEKGIQTIILQSGDDFYYTREVLCSIIAQLKKTFPDTAITLSCGERPLDEYRAFKYSGADRYLIKHETYSESLYSKMHPDMSFKKRIGILESLRKIGFQVGTGSIIGLPEQTIEDIAQDILFMKDFIPDMAAMGPFIPQSDTPLKNVPRGNLELTIRSIAITRLLLQKTNIPSTTALATLDPSKGQVMALKAGANVIMPDFTPIELSKDYKIYDKTTRVTLENAKETVLKAHKTLAFTRGDSLLACTTAIK